MIVALFIAIVATATAAPSSHTFSLQNDGSYNFFYDTGKDGGSHSRSETRNQDGIVIGKYSYEDPNGEMRVVNYRAGDFGYVAKGDVGVSGAPGGQFPADVEMDIEKDAKKEVADENEETKDEKTETVNETADDEDEEDIKGMKLPEPSDDGPPEGFPVGFFGPFFQGLRRLPEPTKEEPETTTTTSDEETSSEKPKDKDAPAKKAFLPFRNFAPRVWLPSPIAYAPSFHHHPSYAYSYSYPAAHVHEWRF